MSITQNKIKIATRRSWLLLFSLFIELYTFFTYIQKAGEVVRAILRVSEVKTAEGSPITTPISTNEV